MAWIEPINFNGGTQPFSYSWNTSPIQTTDTAFNLDANYNYILDIVDSEGCTDQIKFFVSDYNMSDTTNLILTYQDSDCPQSNNGSANINTSLINGTSPYTFEWLNSSVTTASISNLETGLYSVTVTDANGCMGIDTFTIDYNYVMDFTINTTNETCPGENDGAIELNVIDPHPDFMYEITADGYGYSYYITANASHTFNSLSTGMYWVTVTDAAGCEESSDTLFITTEPFNL